MKATIHTAICAMAMVLTAATGIRAAEGFVDPQAEAAKIAPHVAELAVSGDLNIFEPRHIRLANSFITIGPEYGNAMGFEAVFAPPMTSSDFVLDLTLDGSAVMPSATEWTPAYYMQRAANGPVRIETVMALATGRTAFVLRILITNTSAAAVSLPADLKISGHIDLPLPDNWTFGPYKPKTGAPTSFDTKTGSLVLSNENYAIAASFAGGGFAASPTGASGRLTIEPGETLALWLGVAAAPAAADACALAAETAAMKDDVITGSITSWENRMTDVYRRMPSLTTDNKLLNLFYARAMASLPLAEWRTPGMARTPWYATAGLDGGCMCAYLWDWGYIAEITSLYDPESTRFYAQSYIKMGLDRHYSISPYETAPIGPWYAYNAYSFTRIIYYYVLMTGDRSILDMEINGATVMEHLEKIVTERVKPDELVDYGTNLNLLELHLTQYEHFVPSPNAERVWTYRAVADLLEMTGRDGGQWRANAAALAGKIMGRMWNGKKGWFSQFDENGRKKTVYSVQIFDMIRTGVLDKAAADRILKHLNNREFLSDYGLHSLSKKDPGYDMADIDWGGPGVYTADAPELATDLYRAGYIAKGDDIVNRILWIGERMPYYPQAITAAKIDYRHNGRSNTVAGAIGVSTVLNGMLGFEITPAGMARFCPVASSLYSTLDMKGLIVRGVSYDVKIADGKYTVTGGGKTYSEAVGNPVEFPVE